MYALLIPRGTPYSYCYKTNRADAMMAGSVLLKQNGLRHMHLGNEWSLEAIRWMKRSQDDLLWPSAEYIRGCEETADGVHEDVE
jgi:hypothetical protein